jgi:hypothetical protein
MENVDRTTTRRALLAAAAGGAAALAAQAVAPLAASAHDPEDVKLGGTNTATATTDIDTSATAGVNAFSATAAGGSAIVATNTGATGSGVSATSATEAAVYAVSGDATNAAIPADAASTAVYGFSPLSANPSLVGTGVWGDSDEVGVYGSGGIGVEGDGFGTGGVGVLGFAATAATTGVYAQADATDRTAPKVKGKVAFSRSGKTAIAARVSSKVITVAGVTTSSLIFAVLATNRPGRWVRAVVPAAGKFTVYLNTSVLSGTTYVVWWIIN